MLGGALGGGALMVMDSLSLSPEDPKDDRLPLPDLLLEALDVFSLRLALLRQTNLDAMDELQARQSDEMEKAIADMVNVADLVGKHIAEVDALETSFRLKTRSLLSSQRARMREYVSMLATSAPPYLEFSLFDPSSVPSSSSSEDSSTQGRSGSKWSRRWFRLRPTDDDSPSPSEKEKSGGKEREGKGMEAVMTVSVGVFRPVLFQITLRTCPLSWPSSLPVQDKKSALSSMRMIYGDSLSAAVMLYDRKLSTSSSAYKQFTAMLAQRPELHFEEFSEQIPEGEMEAGDVFVTRHSNVPSLHIVFHIVIDQPLQPLSDSALSLDTDPRSIQGFRNLLAVSAHYDIASLSFPLLLLPPDALSDQHLSHPSCVARSIVVIYALKMMLQGGSLNNLKELNLQLPKVSNEMFQKYRAAVKNVFNLQIGC